MKKLLDRLKQGCGLIHLGKTILSTLAAWHRASSFKDLEAHLLVIGQ